LKITQMKKLLLLLKKIKATEADGWEHAMNNSCCPGDDWADGYNQAVKDIAALIKKSLAYKDRTRRE
jgi:hypothetical protein